MILAAHFGQPLAAGPAVEPALDPEMAGQSHRARIVERADREVDVRAVDIMEAERRPAIAAETARTEGRRHVDRARSEEHTSELQSLMRISYAVFCLKKKKQKK